MANFDLPPEVTLARLDAQRELLGDVNRQLGGHDPAATFDTMDRHVRRAFDILHTASVKGAFDLAAEPAAVRERYGLNPHGQSVLQARRLVEAGVPLVTVFWPSDGRRTSASIGTRTIATSSTSKRD